MQFLSCKSSPRCALTDSPLPDPPRPSHTRYRPPSSMAQLFSGRIITAMASASRAAAGSRAWVARPLAAAPLVAARPSQLLIARASR